MSFHYESARIVKELKPVTKLFGVKLIKKQDWDCELSFRIGSSSDISGAKFYIGLVSHASHGNLVFGIDNLIFFSNYACCFKNHYLYYMVIPDDIGGSLQFYNYIIEDYPKYITRIFSNVYLKYQTKYL